MPPIMRKQQRSDTAILAGLVVFRAINASLVKTFFSPDEYWQALEVGHRITFGYGYLTWEWDVGLRSALHPALFAGLYKALYMLGIDDGSLFIYAPRLLQSVFAAVADFYAYRFAYRLFENQVTANWTNTRKLNGSSLDDRRSVLLAVHLCVTLNNISNLKQTPAIMWLFLGASLLIEYVKAGDIYSTMSTLANVAVIGNIHRRNTGPLDIWFVTCEPPLGDIDSATYKDESDIFYEDPVAFMNDRATRSAQKNLLKDSHLVLFEDLLRSWPDMPLWLESRGYHECARFFNSHFHDDRRRRGDVLVYCSI
ncbi:glycosylphosphatidylinositol anchor biosynthesis [Gamsiella multidivaricata]|nr:glycosylphosphatidylinositol anchor biosynthesis [Gamsiella multidivaricata]